ncbi:hypothetical protein B2J93_3746 [Marssonina coronariae]|uniref:Uncharacterized protein n=1 Tax=Diplocarpon coronariae TaxID=2795749 RepID=A0A218YZ61_9HELO|nr:hypothetical protein B2J93_3746 [Marssonina coronariae]
MPPWGGNIIPASMGESGLPPPQITLKRLLTAPYQRRALIQTTSSHPDNVTLATRGVAYAGRTNGNPLGSIRMCEPAGNALAVHGAHPHGGPSPPTVELSAMPAQCSYCQKQSAEGEAAAASEEVVEPVSGDRRQADGMGVRTRGLARGVERAQEGGDERDGPRKPPKDECQTFSLRRSPRRRGEEARMQDLGREERAAGGRAYIENEDAHREYGREGYGGEP